MQQRDHPVRDQQPLRPPRQPRPGDDSEVHLAPRLRRGRPIARDDLAEMHIGRGGIPRRAIENLPRHRAASEAPRRRRARKKPPPAAPSPRSWFSLLFAEADEVAPVLRRVGDVFDAEQPLAQPKAVAGRNIHRACGSRSSAASDRQAPRPTSRSSAFTGVTSAATVATAFHASVEPPAPSGVGVAVSSTSRSRSRPGSLAPRRLSTATSADRARPARGSRAGSPPRRRRASPPSGARTNASPSRRIAWRSGCGTSTPEEP